MRLSTTAVLAVSSGWIISAGGAANGQCELGRFHGVTNGYGGYSVSVDGEWLAFGMPYEDGPLCSATGLECNRGAVRVYRKYDNGTPNDATDDYWQSHALLYAAEREGSALFGWSVSVSGSYLAVGTPYKDNRGANANSGEVDVFRFNGTSWVHDNTLWPGFDAAHTAGDLYGYSVALSKGPDNLVPFLVVGTPGHDSTASGAGAAYVYRRQPTPNIFGFYWLQESKLTPTGIAAGDQLGFAAGATHGTGERIVAGAPYDDDGATSSGSAWVFAPGRTGGWSGQKLTSVAPQTNAGFGRSVAIAHSATLLANVVVVGEPYYDRPGFTDSGRVHVFQSDGGSWNFQQALAGSVDRTKWGWSVGTSGDMILVGATDNFGSLPPQPSRLFFLPEGGWWNNAPSFNLIGEDTVSDDRFGDAVALDAETAVIGAHRADQVSTDAGAAYAFGIGPNMDEDTYADICDNCPADANQNQADADNDTVGDVCDICPGHDDLADGDGDAAPDGCDNCPTVSNSGQEDGDADGFGDACDNCLFAANGPEASTCLAGQVTPCSVHEDCDTFAGAQDGYCSATFGVCIAGLVTTCLNDAECDDVGSDGTCGPSQTLNDPLAGDGDGDGTGDVCDNCPADGNPNQADFNGNGLGDVCDPAFSIGSELLPPDDPAYADVIPSAYPLAQVTPSIAAFYYDKVFCASGTPGSCSLWEGRWFVNEPGVIEIQWKDLNGVNVGDPVVYVATDSVATSQQEGAAGTSYDVVGVQYFQNWANVGNGAPVTIDTAFNLTIQYNSTFQVNSPPNTPSDVEVVGNLVTVHGTATGKIVFQYTDGPNGRLMGLEVVDILDYTRQDLFVDVGRKLEIPAGADCKAGFIQNVDQSTFKAAWQRNEATLDMWPIRPEPTANNLVVAWYESTPFTPNCWHNAIRGYVADWPDDPQEHIVVEDPAPDLPVVNLPVGEADTYCAAEVMFPGQFSPPFARIVNGNQYTASAAGYAVLRLDIKSGLPESSCATNREDVKFEVVRTYDHLAPYDEVQSIGVYEGEFAAPIGTQLTHPEHDPDTPVFPFGYLLDGQPFAPDIYTDSGQIFPANASDVHGTLEVWWFEESAYAPQTYWPHRSAQYYAEWPTPTTSALMDPIIIASRSGAGNYPDGAEIYHQGVYNGSTVIAGWNPNDEHAVLLPIAGSLRAFAVRDDNPWNVTSGHPYVLVKYPEKLCSVGANLCNNEGDCGVGETCDATGLWLMGVHEVIAEQAPYFFDYTDFPNQSDPSQMLPVVAGLPIDPMFPVNFAAAACLDGSVPPAPLTTIVGDALWVDRTGGIWAVEERDDDGTNFPSTGTVYLWENWAPDDLNGSFGGCDPWLGYANGGNGSTPHPIIYRPGWPPAPPDCTYPTDPACARPLHPGALVDQGGQCGAIEVLHDSVGIRIIDPTYEVSVDNVVLPPDVDFAKLPPHLVGGEIGGGGEWPDRIRFANQVLYFRGIMSGRDREYLYGLSQDASYRDEIDALQALSRQQLTVPLAQPAEKWVSVANRNVEVGWVTVAVQNDDDCASLPVSVEVWRVDCPPEKGRVQVIQPTCPFNEKLVLQHTVDGGGEPEYMIYQWQWSADYDPSAPELATWNDYNPPTGYGDGVGLREVVIEGASPFTLADSWWRVRYRGYLNCPCGGGGACNEQGEPWANHLVDDGTVVSEWSDPQLAEGWVKRVVRGINPFDQRVEDFHVNAAATYVDMISQAGTRFESPIPLNCTPANINGLGLIEVYETVLRRARAFSIDVGVSYDPATLAILLVTSKINDLYMLLGNEAFADASDPTIGLFAGAGDPPPTYDPHAVFCFEDQLPSILEEELALYRGRDAVRPPDIDADGRIIATVYNRLPWNFTSGDGQVAYANNYQVTNVVDARGLYPQGHGDAWGHYLTAIKRFYNLLRHPVFDWFVSTEAVLVGGQPVQVGFQYERDFAKAAAARARTGADIVSLAFRQRFNADPAQQGSYPDVNADRAWGVSDWARRAGQGAYFDWVTANALLDDVDDDPAHENTIKKIDRTTVPELREIAASYLEIQSTLDKATQGLNPLGLAANVVPFGLNPNEIEENKTHFEQVFERAVGSLSNAVTAFNYANDNTRRLRAQQDRVEDFADLVEERELDFNSRLIEMFGKPYPQDIGPGGAYDTGYDGADIFHFDYVEPSALIGLESSGAITVSRDFIVRTVNAVTGEVTEAQRTVQFYVSTDGIGFIKPQGWTTRPELGEIQFARSEVLQVLGRYKQALESYAAHVDQIEFQAALLESLYALNRNTLQVLNDALQEQRSLHDEILSARAAQHNWRIAVNLNNALANAGQEALPKSVGLATDATSAARGAILIAAALAAEHFQSYVTKEERNELRLQQKLQEAAAAQQIQITGYQGDYQVEQQIAVLQQLVRALPAMELELLQLSEAVQQAAGRYHSAIGRGLRLLEARTAFRQRTAEETSESRYQDLAFRVFRNDALQKYRAQFDVAARYAYLAARAYDYETNLLGTDQQSGQQYLTHIVKERVLGAFVGGSPLVGNGLAGRLAELWNNWVVVKPQLGFNNANEINRTFSLRWEMLRIPNSVAYDAQWRDALSAYVVNNLNNVQEYRQYCQPLQPPVPNNPAVVIPISTTVQSTMNFFGWPSTGDATLPSDRFAIKMHSYAVKFSHFPGFPLNQQANVYLVPVGADIMRTPTCPEAPIRQWHLLDQTLPIPFPIGEQDLSTVGWMPWDALDGGSAAMVRRRLIPTVAACAVGDPQCTDISYKLTGRSVWNTRWLLIIPGSELLGADPALGVSVFINGTTPTGTGVRDIKLEFQSYGYSGCLSGAAAGGTAADGQLERPLP